MKDFQLMFSHTGKTINLIGKKRVNIYKKLYEYLSKLQKDNSIKLHENYLGDNELAQNIYSKKYYVKDLNNDLIEKNKGKIESNNDWGKKKLAYPIDKQKYGTYILLQFEAVQVDKIIDFDSWMKLNKQVLRHMTTVLGNEPEVYAEEEDKEINKKDDSLSDNNELKSDESEVERVKDEIIDQINDEKIPEKEEDEE